MALVTVTAGVKTPSARRAAPPIIAGIIKNLPPSSSEISGVTFEPCIKIIKS